MSTGTALVTGASEGIGYEFARVLAAKGYAVVLVARREPVLQERAEALRREHGVEAHVIAADLAEPDAARRLHDAAASRGLVVDFLVNNAGLLTNGPFHEADLDGQSAMVKVNVLALTEMMHVFMADMVRRGGGRILNVASTASWVGLPEEGVYSATKAYVLALTLAVNDEMRARGTGVDVTALCPAFTDTKMLDNPEQGLRLSVPRFLVSDAVAVARAGIDGCLDGKAVVIPGAANAVSISAAGVLPKVWATRLMGRVYRRAMSGTV